MHNKTIENLGKEYKNHEVFNRLSEYLEFYNDLSDLIRTRALPGTIAIINFDSYIYTSIKGTIESIKDILIKGRINDAYALLRKYYDLTIINVYSNLFLKEEFSRNNKPVVEINNWLNGSKPIPRYSVMHKYINESSKLKEITKLLQKDKKQ